METVATTTSGAGALAYLPIGLFGSVMGLTGLSVAWHLAHDRFGAPLLISGCIGAAAVVAFIAIAAGYLVKVVSAPGAARAEFEHPIAGSLFGTLLISLLLAADRAGQREPAPGPRRLGRRRGRDDRLRMAHRRSLDDPSPAAQPRRARPGSSRSWACSTCPWRCPRSTCRRCTG